MGQWAEYMEAIGVDPYGDYDRYGDRHGNFGYEEDSECYDSDQVESEEEDEPLPTFKSRKNEPEYLPAELCHDTDGHRFCKATGKIFRNIDVWYDYEDEDDESDQEEDDESGESDDEESEDDESEDADEDEEAKFKRLEKRADKNGDIEINGSVVVYPYKQLVLQTYAYTNASKVITASDGKKITRKDLAEQFNEEAAPKFWVNPMGCCFLEDIRKDERKPGYYIVCFGS